MLATVSVSVVENKPELQELVGLIYLISASHQVVPNGWCDSKTAAVSAVIPFAPSSALAENLGLLSYGVNPIS